MVVLLSVPKSVPASRVALSLFGLGSQLYRLVYPRDPIAIWCIRDSVVNLPQVILNYL